MLDTLGGKEKGATIVFFFSFFSIVTTFPIMLFQFETFSLEQFVFLILAGVAASCAQFALTAAYKYAQQEIFQFMTILKLFSQP